MLLKAWMRWERPRAGGPPGRFRGRARRLAVAVVVLGRPVTTGRLTSLRYAEIACRSGFHDTSLTTTLADNTPSCCLQPLAPPTPYTYRCRSRQQLPPLPSNTKQSASTTASASASAAATPFPHPLALGGDSRSRSATPQPPPPQNGEVATNAAAGVNGGVGMANNGAVLRNGNYFFPCLVCGKQVGPPGARKSGCARA
jgi:hypothetical protein